MKKITIGIIAHVDSGKTTLSEALLYLTGAIRSFGRVDKGASFLDNDNMERRRGITIYSKQARFSYGDTQFVLIDTPGHADFSAEMERALQILDYAVLIISAADGIKGRTRELWKLLSYYQVPVFVFVNKMDQNGADKETLLSAIRSVLSQDAVDLTCISDLLISEQETAGNSPGISERLNIFYDVAAMCSEEAMESYLETGKVPLPMIAEMIRCRRLFPCLFGSALKQEGVEQLLMAMDALSAGTEYGNQFGARVYKILRDADGSRLTLLKITGGSLKTKTLLPDEDRLSGSSEQSAGTADTVQGSAQRSAQSKINQIRLYNGTRYTLTDSVEAGEICALTGLDHSWAGQGFGVESQTMAPMMVPVLNYRVLLPEDTDPVKVFPWFKILEEENPELKAAWDEERREISVSVMGKVQIEILTSVLMERFGLAVSFDSGQVMYRETIAAPVIGAGHFEPLRHYAEAVLLIQPLPTGTGLIFDSAVRTEKLSRNWQRLILTHLEEKQHRGVLTGAPITDMKITVIGGRAHLKHTEGGDFRQAVYRAVRQGLMMAQNVLLEPYYRFVLEIPANMVGRAMTDLDRMHAEFGSPLPGDTEGFSIIEGRAPVIAIKDYPADVAAWSKGAGHISFFVDGYDVCTDARAVIEEKGYDPLSDRRNTPDSVFCANGSGYIVPYDEVYSHLDVSPDSLLEGVIAQDEYEDPELTSSRDLGKAMEAAGNAGLKSISTAAGPSSGKPAIGTEEIDAIIAKISGSNSKDKKKGNNWKRKFGDQKGIGGAVDNGVSARSGPAGISSRIFAIEDADFVVVDGYNVIFAWPELSDLARVNVDSARDALVDILSAFRSMAKGKVIAVFDAYRVKGHATEQMMLQDVEIIFTGEEETADQYIEKFTNTQSKNNKIAVVTSDGLEQIITRGQGCMLISSRDFKKHVEALSEDLREKYRIIRK